MCFSSVNGAWPIQLTPSPPIWLISEVRRSGIQIAMPWQPMPAIARLPSGTRVEVLCGQPEQKNGVRATLPGGAFSAAPWLRGGPCAACSSGESPVCFISRSAITMATPVGDSSPSLGQERCGRPRRSCRSPAAGGRPARCRAAPRAGPRRWRASPRRRGSPRALGEAPRAFRLERPGHADLVEADAERPAALLVDAEIVERLAHVEIGLAGGDDAEARRAAARSPMRSKPLARTKARTAAIFGPCRRFSASSGGSGQRMSSPPGGSWKSVGMTILMRSGSTQTEAPLSTVSEIALKPTQQPE